MTLSVTWPALLPILAPIAGALLILIVDAAAPRSHGVSSPIALAANGIGLIGALWLAAVAGPDTLRTLCLPAPGVCFVDADGVGVALQGLALLGGLIVTLLLRPLLGRGDARGTRHAGAAVTHTLVLTTVAGATIVSVSREAATWLIGLELATLPVIALLALHGTRRAAHGSLSLLTTSVVSFALLVVGVALWLVAVGDVTFGGAGVSAAWADPSRRPAFIVAVLLLVAGLGFKLSAVPFHQWTPSGYAGASIPIAALLASVSKVAAVGGLVVLMRGIATLAGSVHPHQLAFAVGTLAAVTMTLGNLVALRQEDVIRFLAWSTIAQAGWVLLPLGSLAESALPAAVGYLGAYVIASLVVFSVVHHVSRTGPARQRSAYAGLFTDQRMLGGAFALALLSLAGLPPGLIGLIAKIVALRPVVGGGLWVLAGIAVLNAVLGVAVYLRWIAPLFGPAAPGRTPPGVPARSTVLAVAIGVGALLLTSVMPQLLLGLAH